MDVTQPVSLDTIKARGSITETDVLGLRRLFNADHHIDDAEATALIALHRSCRDQHPEWVYCFVEMLTDHLVNQAEPEGYLTLANADWLVSQIAPTGRIESKAELELLINVLDKSRWSPQSLACFALEQVELGIREGSGPLRPAVANEECKPGHVTDSDVEVLRRILYAFGGDGNVAVTRAEAEVLCRINDATRDNSNAESWRDLFLKSISNCVLSVSGYSAPSREQALAREAWLDRRGELTLGGMFASYRRLSNEERAIQRLERQKIEIITHEEVPANDAAWLAERFARDGALTSNETELIAILEQEKPELHADLRAVLDRLLAAA